MPTHFDRDTALTRHDDGWHGQVSGRWTVKNDRPNGGYIASILLRALQAESTHPDPLTMTTHYLAGPAPGPVRVTVELLKTGRSHSMLHGRLWQDDFLMATSTAAFGGLGRGGPTHLAATMPRVSGPEESPPLDMGAWGVTPLHQQIDARVPPVGLPEGIVGGWTRLPDRATDVAAIPLFMDSWPPAVFPIMGGGWAPTLELTVHFRARPTRAWHLALFRSRFLKDGYVEEDGELWADDGVLVAQSRQLAMYVPGR